MVALWLELLLNVGTIAIFIILMIYSWISGSKQNVKLLESIESMIRKSVKQRGVEIEKHKMRDNEYEFRCHTRGNQIKILTLHLVMVNRSFFPQRVIGLFYKEREKLFIGAKFGGEIGEEDPAYPFDVVPYSKKSYISQRFEQFVVNDDIPTINKNVDRDFMIKSVSASYVTHFVNNEEIIGLINRLGDQIQHISLKSSKEDTDPHLSITYNFFGLKNPPINEFIRLFFLLADEHFKNHDSVKKLINKGKKGQYSTMRGAARRGSSKSRKKKKRT